jgi:hypothetical protein
MRVMCVCWSRAINLELEVCGGVTYDTQTNIQEHTCYAKLISCSQNLAAPCVLYYYIMFSFRLRGLCMESVLSI